jgi:hypothetical protein
LIETHIFHLTFWIKPEEGRKESRKEGREGGREGRREGGREGKKEGGRKEGRKEGKKGRREGGTKRKVWKKVRERNTGTSACYPCPPAEINVIFSSFKNKKQELCLSCLLLVGQVPRKAFPSVVNDVCVFY